ncbi:hypothetical protein ACOMHN_018466 [Nucella lapillus]
MYSGRSANLLPPRHGLSGPISAEHLRSRASSSSSQASRRGPLRADHDLPTPRSANDREIEDISRRAAQTVHRPQARAPRRPLSAKLHPTYYTDLVDDTDPRGHVIESSSDTSRDSVSSRARSTRTRRYLIKRPHSAPIYGRITPVRTAEEPSSPAETSRAGCGEVPDSRGVGVLPIEGGQDILRKDSTDSSLQSTAPQVTVTGSHVSNFVEQVPRNPARPSSISQEEDDNPCCDPGLPGHVSPVQFVENDGDSRNLRDQSVHVPSAFSQCLKVSVDSDSETVKKTSKFHCESSESTHTAESGTADSRNKMEKSVTKVLHTDSTPTDTQKDMLASKTSDGKRLTTVTDTSSQPQRSGDASDGKSMSSEDSKASAGSGKVFSLLSSKVLKGGTAGTYENTTVKFNTNVTRHEVITIKGSSHATADKSIVLNDSGFPENLASTFKAKPVIVRERKVSSSSCQEQPTLTTFTGQDRKSPSTLSLSEMNSNGAMKLSPRQGSENDLELLSTASRIVQAQRSDGTLDDPTDDDHELVVIREYVFAARKSSTEEETTPSEVTKARPSDTLNVTDPSLLVAKENPSSSHSLLKENDSGLDSPPPLQECHLPPVKPKRTGRASREIHEDELQTLQTAAPQNNENFESTEPAALPSEPENPENSSSKSAQSPIPETFENKLLSAQQSQPIEHVDSSADISPSEKTKPQTEGSKAAERSTESTYAGDGPQNDLPHEDDPQRKSAHSPSKGTEPKVVAIPTTVLQCAMPSQAEKPVAKYEQVKDVKVKHDQVKDVKVKQTSDDKPELCARWSRYRDSLTEEEYNKPWESDFSNIEKDIRDKITQAFPSAEEDEEQEQKEAQIEASASGQGKISPESFSLSAVKQSAGKHQSSNSKDLGDKDIPVVSDRLNKDSLEDLTNQSKPLPQTTESLNTPVETNAEAGSKQNTEATIIPAATTSTLRPASKPRKTSAQFDRPLLPQPPPPPTPAVKISKEETKPLHAEKPHRLNIGEKGSPLHHRKLKEKFKKVFSHSSDDKKMAKAEKKSTPQMKKKELGSPKDDQDKAPNSEQNKSETGNISSQPEDMKKKSCDSDESVQTADHQGAEAAGVPEHDYMMPNISTVERSPAEESSDPNDPLLYTSANYEVKLPFPPKEAKKILKAEKKNAAKTPTDEAKEYSSLDESKAGSPKVPNRALKWIREKLATKGKKSPHSKQYNISGPEDLDPEEGDDVSGRESKSPRASDTNSESEDSHDSSDSSDSDTDEEEERKTKSPRKIPFWGGKKDKKKKKKKAAQTESDSDSSAEESKSKLFSWSLGRKKVVDSSDHEDNLPAGFKKTVDWTPGEESSGVSGTFRKISDDAPQKQDQVQTKSGTAATSPQQHDIKESEIKIEITEAPTDDKETSDMEPVSEAKDAPKEAEIAFSIDTNTQLVTDVDSGTSSDPAHPKWFSFEDSEQPQNETNEDGDYAQLGKDATANPNSDKVWKQSKSSGYVLARPMFLEDENEDASSSKAEKLTEAHSSLSDRNVSENQREKEPPVNGSSENSISEDRVVPTKAARPVHQAFSSPEKLTGQELHKRTPYLKQPPSPVLPVEQKRVTFAKPQPKPILKKETEENSATEEDIIPSKADDAFKGLRVNRGSISKPESPAKKEGDEHSRVPLTDNQTDVVPNSEVHADSAQLASSEQQLPLDTDLTFNIRPTDNFADSPRSNDDSDDSAGRTYLDKPGFLDVARVSWGSPDNKPTKLAHSDPGPPDANNTPEKKQTVDTSPSSAVEKSDNSAPSSVFGITLKKSGVPKNTENAGFSGSHVDRHNPKREEPVNTEDLDTHRKNNPHFAAAVKTAEKTSSNEDKPDSSPKHPAAAKVTDNTATDDTSLMSSTNRRKTRAVTPAELKSARHQDGASGAHPPKPVAKILSPTSDNEDSPIDWLDSGIHSTAPNVQSQRPGKPSAISPKPKVFAKPKIFQGKVKVESPSSKSKQEISSEQAAQKEVLFPSENPAVQNKAKESTSKPAVREKPTPPSKPGKPVKTSAVSEVIEATKTSPDTRSPEPKPRKLLKQSKPDAAEGRPDRADNPSKQEMKIVLQGVDTGEESTLLCTPADDDSRKERLTDPLTSSWGGNSKSPTYSCLGDFTLGLGTRPKDSTSGRSEDSEFSLDHCLGDFTLALETQSGGSAKTVPSRDKTDSIPDDTSHVTTTQNHGSMHLTESGSEFTDVTELVESRTTSTLSPLFQSTPFTPGLPSSGSTTDDVTLSSVSTIQRSDPAWDTTSERNESNIYEPIFFEDLFNPRSSRPTEAPPVRPEKQGKRRLEPPRIVHSDFDDDADNMYDIPRTHQTFAFPKESTLPVLSIVDKRNSKTSLTSMKSLEPEDSIPPYATCHRTPPFVKQESDYGDDENPYMNDDDEDLPRLCSSLSQSAEKGGDTPGAEEAVHASLKEIFPEASTTSPGKEENPTSEKPRDIDQVNTGDCALQDKPGSLKFRIGSSSSESSSDSEPSHDGGTASPKEKKQEIQNKSDKNASENETPNTRTDKPQEEEEDQYLKSPEYKHSVEEINKLYAALEKEEQEMERQSSFSQPPSAGTSTTPRTSRMLSFEEQRAELKPLKPRLADKPSEQTRVAEEQKVESLKSTAVNSDTKEIKPVSQARKHSPTATESPVTDTGGSKTNSPQTSPRLQKTSNKGQQLPGQEQPEGSRADVHPLNEKEGGGKETPASKESALHRLAGFFKSGVKGSPGTDRKLKVTSKEHDGGSKGADGGKEHGNRTSGTDEDSSPSAKDKPQDPSLVSEVMQYHMYAQVHKPSADSAPKPIPDTPEDTPEEEEASSPAAIGSPSTAKKTSTLSSFFVTKGNPQPGPKPDKMAGETEKSDTNGGSPQATKVNTVATFGVNLPFVGAVPSKSASKDLPEEKLETDKDGNRPAKDDSVPGNPVEESVEIIPSSKISLLNSSPDASSPESAESKSPVKSGTAPELPKKPNVPKPLKKPDVKNTSWTPGGSEPPEQLTTKPQPKPRDLTSTYSDADTKLKVPMFSDPEPEAAPHKSEDPEEAPEVPRRHSSLLSPDALLEAAASSEPSKALPEVSQHGPKSRLRVPGAGAFSESEESEDEEETDGEDGGNDHHGGDSPPLPERRYRETQGGNKYNEYSNVIRVDSTRLKEARIRSLSRPLLTEDPPDKKNKADLFGKKKKNKGGGGGEGKEGAEEGEEENVYEVVDDSVQEPKAKNTPSSLSKHTWPKQKKRKKSESGDHPATTTTPTTTTHHPPLIAVDSSHGSKDVRPIGRLLQLNPDGTQVVELIRPPNGQLGVQLTQGNEETLRGKFVSGFVDKSTQKLLSGILHISDQVLKINDQSIDDCPLIEVHDIIDSQQRLKFLVLPGDNQ